MRQKKPASDLMVMSALASNHNASAPDRSRNTNVSIVKHERDGLRIASVEITDTGFFSCSGDSFSCSGGDWGQIP
jgi:hypothetical protein